MHNQINEQGLNRVNGFLCHKQTREKDFSSSVKWQTQLEIWFWSWALNSHLKTITESPYYHHKNIVSASSAYPRGSSPNGKAQTALSPDTSSSFSGSILRHSQSSWHSLSSVSWVYLRASPWWDMPGTPPWRGVWNRCQSDAPSFSHWWTSTNHPFPVLTHASGLGYSNSHSSRFRLH